MPTTTDHATSQIVPYQTRVRYQGKTYLALRATTWLRYGRAVLVRLDPGSCPRWIRLAEVAVVS